MSADGSLLPLMEALDAALPPALVPAAARRRLRALSATLPFMSSVGFECHLGGAAPRVDLLAHTGERGALRTLLAGTPLGQAVKGGGEATELLERWVDAILFEFDLDGAAGARPPALFLNFKPGAVVDGASLARLAACVAGPLDEGAALLLRRVAAAASGETPVTHLGAMASRRGAPLRVNLGAVAADALRGFVGEVGWGPGPRARLDELLTLAEAFAHHFVLAFDLARGPLRRVGLECYMGAAPGYGDHWPHFLARLGEAGLCTPAEAAALLAWPGRTTDAGARPPGHEWLASFLGAGHAPLISRTLNHVKLVSAPGGPPGAKAYLVATHGWPEPAS